MSNSNLETTESIFPKMTNADVLMMVSVFSAATCLLPLALGMLFNDAFLTVSGIILLVTCLVSIPFTVRLTVINSNRLKEASNKVIHNLELEYGITISPSEELFNYDTTVQITDRDILATDSNGESVLVALRTDDTGSKVVPFIIRNAVKIS